MTRIRQFANDMGISYNKAKNLVQKGKKRRDGGSTILENYMPIKIVAKKKEVAKPKPRPKNLKKKDPFRADKTKSLNREFSKRTAKTNEDAMKSIKKSGGGSMRKPRKGEKSMRKLTDESKAIRKFLTRIDMIPINIRKSLGVKGKAMGGLNSSLKDIPPENKGLPKLPKEVRNKMGFKKKGGTMKMSKGGVARGTGAAVKGTGFKGVY